MTTEYVAPQDDRTLSTDDADAFVALIEPYLGKMARVASRLGGPSDRDDIVQESLLSAWKHRRQYSSARGTVSAWLLAITAHEATRLTRKFTRSFRTTDPMDLPTTDALLDLKAAMRTLTPRERLAVDLYYYAGLSVAETAAAMGCSDGTVKSTLASGRERLRSRLR